MYNRYTQKPDGSFQRNRMADSFAQKEKPRQSPPPPVQEMPQQSTAQSPSPLGFLKQLLPKGFDMGDLAIVFLLLLMAGDSEENRSNALLTIALYFIM